MELDGYKAVGDGLEPRRRMVELIAAVALAPWAQPLRFRPLPGWRTGANGTFNSSYGPVPDVASPKESTAWMAMGTRYRDGRAADPPDETLTQLPRRGIVVFAAAYQSAQKTQRRIALRFADAKHHPCCDGTYVAGGEYALSGAGPAVAYSVIVRVYFGSPPTRSDARAGTTRPRPSRAAPGQMKESSLGSSAPRLCECSTMKPGRNAPWLGWLYMAAPAAFIGYGLFLVSRSVILAVVVGAAVLLLCRFLIGLNAPPSNGDDG